MKDCHDALCNCASGDFTGDPVRGSTADDANHAQRAPGRADQVVHEARCQVHGTGAHRPRPCIGPGPVDSAGQGVERPYPQLRPVRQHRPPCAQHLRPRMATRPQAPTSTTSNTTCTRSDRSDRPYNPHHDQKRSPIGVPGHVHRHLTATECSPCSTGWRSSSRTGTHTPPPVTALHRMCRCRPSATTRTTPLDPARLARLARPAVAAPPTGADPFLEA